MDTPLRYYARPGCKSDTKVQAAAEVYKYFAEGFLSAKPAIPALNRWNKVYAPLTWWLAAMQFHGVINKAFSLLQQREQQEAEGFLVDADILGPQSEATYRKMEAARFAKARDWPSDACTFRSLSISVTLFRQALPPMGLLFKSTKNMRTLDFVVRQTSPAEALMRNMKQALADLNNPAWQSLRPWSPDILHDTACSAWTFLGEVFMRSVMVQI